MNFPLPSTLHWTTTAAPGQHDGAGHVYLVDETGRKVGTLWGPPDLKVRNADLFAAASDMLAALQAMLPEVDEEIEQRKHGGNDEYWQGLQALSDAGHAAVRKAEGR
jgi:hypothetical protein